MAVSRVPSTTLPEGNTQTPSGTWCCTQIKVFKSNYTWTINNFSYCREEKGAFLKSSSFSEDKKDKLKWFLRLYPKGPKGSDDDNKNFISLFLELDSGNNLEVHANFKFSIINARQEKVNTMENQQQFVQGGTWGFRKFIRRDALLKESNGLLSDGKLTISCEVSVIADSVNLSGQFSVPECRMSQDFNKLFDNHKFSDVVLCAEGIEFPAHKNVLAARSPVFSAMFDHPLEENMNNRVNIADIAPDVLREMLRFIYTGNVIKLKDIAGALLAAANKYDLDRLKVMCEESLHSMICTEKAAEFLILADLHNAVQLKALALVFINIHATEVMETDGWKDMISTHAHLIAEIFKASHAPRPYIEPCTKRVKRN